MSELCYMRVTTFLYGEYRHWLKRHGWLLVQWDWHNQSALFASIKPIFAGQEIEAVFRRQGGGVSFVEYREVTYSDLTKYAI